MRRKPYPITDLTGGINVGKDPVYIENKSATNLICARYDKGIIKKDWGWTEFGTILLGTPMMLDWFVKSDDVYRLLCFTTTSAYLWNTTTLDWSDITLGLEVCDCDDQWTAAAKVTATAETTDYKEGTGSAKLVIAADHTTGIAAYKDFGGVDIHTYSHLHFMIKSTVALAANDYSILLDDTSGCVSPIENLAVPALVANTWTRVSVALADAAHDTAIASIALKVNVDKGANTVYIDEVKAVTQFTGSTQDRFSGCTFLDTYIVTNKIDAMQKWAGTGYCAALGGSPPKCKNVAVFMNRLVTCFTNEGGQDYPYRVKWSDVGTIETWTASNYLEAYNTTDYCVALMPLGPRCFLFKENSINDLAYVGGTSVFNVRKKVDSIGTQAAGTLDHILADSLFFSHDGIYVFDQTTVQSLSDRLYPWLFTTGEKLVNLAAVEVFNAKYFKETREYWISLCEANSTTPSLLLKLDINHKAWTRRDDKPITCMGNHKRTEAAPTWATVTGTWATIVGTWGRKALPGSAPTILLGYNTGQIYEDDRQTSTTDEFLFETKDFLWAHASRVMDCRVESRYGGFTLYYSTDGGATWSSGHTFAFTADWAENTLPINLTTQLIRFRITTSEPRFELRWIEPWYLERVRSKELEI